VALDITAVAVRGRWVKHTYPGSPPLPARDPPPDNRWQRGTTVDALYLADCEETAWAEWYRHLAERAIPPLAQMPRELWSWQVDAEVADLSTDEKLAAVGLEPPNSRTPRVAFLPTRWRAALRGGLARAARAECSAPGRPDPVSVPRSRRRARSDAESSTAPSSRTASASNRASDLIRVRTCWSRCSMPLT